MNLGENYGTVPALSTQVRNELKLTAVLACKSITQLLFPVYGALTGREFLLRQPD